ncbi:MAG TPA: anti-sigma factor [Pyrinomonadaceae bacterium]
MVHEDYKEMLAARALSALDADDRRALNEHLLVCTECRGELETWEATASILSLSATEMEPSPSVRERILQQVREESRSQTVQDAGARVIPITSRSRTMSYGLVAAVVIFSLLIGWIALMSAENRRAKAEIARLNEQIQSTEKRLSREREIVAILTAPGSRHIPLSGTASAPNAHAMFAYDQSGQARLLAQGLPTAPAGKGYQLWFIVNNKPLPANVFNTDAGGTGSMEYHVPSGLDDKVILAITMENSAGADSPTSPILLRSEL